MDEMMQGDHLCVILRVKGKNINSLCFYLISNS